ncbi:hypothetical protein AAEU32_04775 [Pseudoalteromonas sp. SSDWG2]|uniref:hypothetical protein n=1 Tax=Pseudoalteromonas sp. SSDWG2 TaxID=3139391 RepID=UPI003BAA79B6
MKYVLLIILLAGAGYYYHRYTTTQDNEQAMQLLLEQIEYQNVDLFELKDASVKRVYAICANNEEMLLQSSRSVESCMQAHDSKQPQCAEHIFRLAPLSIESRKDMVDYAKRYTRCTLPYKDLKYQSL